VHPSVSVLTPIAIDHAQWLGDTIAEIAMEKAGIIKHGIPVVSAPQDELARTVIAHIAFEREATCQFLEAPIDSPDAGRVGLAGSHQRWNAALAVAALEAGGIVIDRAAQARGLQTVRWPGRFQQIDDGLVLDGAHNPAAAHALVATWREKFGSRKATIIFGVLADKDVDGVWRALAPIAGHVYAVAPKSARALAADVVAPRLQAETPAIPCEVALDLGEAVASAARNDLPILVTGSLFLVGEALAHLRGENEFEPSAQ
jgi:dihydrofolate synthase/folylpolyglutamate synthase